MGTDKQLLGRLSKLHSGKTLILGVGNTLKGDDGVGPLVCEQLAGKVSAELIDVGTAPENFIQKIIRKAPQNLLIVDAIDFKTSPGTIEIFRPEQLTSTITSTHVLSPKIFVDMICSEINVEVYFIGIQPAQIAFGQSLSAPVSESVKRVIDILTKIFVVDQS